MKPVIRNFLNAVRRYKMALALNILGLSVAFAAFMVIMFQLDYDLRFDKFHKNYDKIFRLEFFVPQFSESHRVSIINRPFAEQFFDSSPHIVAGAIMNPFGGDVFFHVENEAGVRNYFKESAIGVTPEFADVFAFDFAEGSEDALKTPGNIIIPLSLSRKLFGRESAVGRQLVYDWGRQTVGAVYRDFPGNTILNNCIYAPIAENENKNNWGNWNYNAFIRVNESSNAPTLVDNFKRVFDPQPVFGIGGWEESGLDVRLTALPDIHFVTDVLYDYAPKASKQTLMILFAIAMVIIAIAAINFTNFSTALTPMRIKNINTQRVLGASRSSLRSALVLEAVAVSFLAYLIGILLVMLFDATPLAKLVNADLSLAARPLIVGGTAAMVLLAGIVAGLYPAFYITSFAPALVLKGSFGLSPQGRKLRNTLIGVQYAASFALIIGASFMYLQNRFMQNAPLGYDKDALMTVDIGQIRGSREAFANQVKTFSGIEEVTYGQFLLSSSDSYMMWGRAYRGENPTFMVLPVHYTFLETMGIEVVEGRGFRREDENTENGVFVFNEAARKEFNLELNTRFDGEGVGSGEIIGFMPDVKYASFRQAVEPMAFYVFGSQNWGDQLSIAYIKLNAGANARAAMSHVRAALSGFNADFPFEVHFFDEVLQRLYEKETSLGSLISLFSLLAIFISIVGVFGLVVFDSESRRKEIGIRKVLGASTLSIIIMFNKAYFKILLVCFAVSAPLAWHVVGRWLQNFAFKTPMYWWVYLFALVAVGIITVATVTFQNWRVANDDPVKAIKTG